MRDRPDPRARGRADAPEAPVREAERATPAAHAAALGLQRAAGNRAASAVLGGRDLTRPAGATLSRGAFDALKKGGQMYLGMDDAGAPFARELMRWRLVGLGADFTKTQADGDWNRFMQDRPEIQLAMVPVLEKVALKAAADGPAPKVLGFWQPDREYKETIRGVLLNELESMRLTLHGCHRIDIQILASVKADGADTIVQMVVTMTWVDVADLHPGTATELEGGELVDDKEFTAAGWDYPIAITFTADGYSTWRVNGGVAAHERGWPPVTGVPKAGFRG